VQVKPESKKRTMDGVVSWVCRMFVLRKPAGGNGFSEDSGDVGRISSEFGSLVQFDAVKSNREGSLRRFPASPFSERSGLSVVADCATCLEQSASPRGLLQQGSRPCKVNDRPVSRSARTRARTRVLIYLDPARTDAGIIRAAFRVSRIQSDAASSTRYRRPEALDSRAPGGVVDDRLELAQTLW